jgi:AGZA family xanthine/uracil permease-like MFS transporter
VALGTALAWLTHTGIAPAPTTNPHFFPPLPVAADLWDALQSGYLLKYLSVILPMGVFTLVGSLQNIEAAEAAGDSYPTAPSLVANGLGTMAAALFGSCFPTTIYIGHPGWKAMGARAGYSVLNGMFFTVVCLGGVLGHIAHAIPIDAGMAIVIWIGLVITAQAFQACPKEHAPAVVVGLLPGVAAWGVLLMNTAMQATKVPLTKELIPAFQANDNWLDGGLALNEGFIFTSMILSAATVALIERKFVHAGAWCFAAAGLSAMGFMHSYRYLPSGGTAMTLWQPAWPWAIGYAIMGASFLAAKWLTVPAENGH